MSPPAASPLSQRAEVLGTVLKVAQPLGTLFSLWSLQMMAPGGVRLRPEVLGREGLMSLLYRGGSKAWDMIRLLAL